MYPVDILWHGIGSVVWCAVGVLGVLMVVVVVVAGRAREGEPSQVPSLVAQWQVDIKDKGLKAMVVPQVPYGMAGGWWLRVVAQ